MLALLQWLPLLLTAFGAQDDWTRLASITREVFAATGGITADEAHALPLRLPADVSVSVRVDAQPFHQPAVEPPEGQYAHLYARGERPGRVVVVRQRDGRTCAGSYQLVDPALVPDIVVEYVDEGVVCGHAPRGNAQDPLVLLERALSRLVLLQEGVAQRYHSPLDLPDLNPYAWSLEQVPAFVVPEGSAALIVHGSSMGWTAIGEHSQRPGTYCIAWVGPAGREHALGLALQVPSAGRVACAPSTLEAARERQQLATTTADLRRLVIAQEAAATWFGGYTALQEELSAVGFDYSHQHFHFTGGLGQMVEATGTGWAAEAVNAAVPGTICRVRVGAVERWPDDVVRQLPEGEPVCMDGSLEERPALIDPYDAKRAALRALLRVHAARSGGLMRLDSLDLPVSEPDVTAQVASAPDIDTRQLPPGTDFRILHFEAGVGFAAEAVHEATTGESCVVAWGTLPRQPRTARDGLAAEHGDITCDGDVTPGTPDAMLDALALLRSELRRLVAVDSMAREAQPDYLVSMAALRTAGFVPADGVEVRLLSTSVVPGGGFSAEATHPGLLPGRSCVVYYADSGEQSILPATAALRRVPYHPLVPVCDRP